MNREVFLTLATRGVMLVLGLATSVMTARWLGPEARGEYLAMVVFAATIVQFANCGLNSTITYHLAGNEQLFSRLAANSLWISTVFCGAIAAATASVIVLGNFWQATQTTDIWLGAATSLPTMYFLFAGALLVARKQIGLFNLLQVLSAVSLLFALALAWMVGGGLSEYLFATLTAWSLTAIAAFALLRRLGASGFRFDPQLLAAGLKYTGKAYVVCVLSFLCLRLNVFALERQSDSLELGYYAIASQLADLLLIFPTTIGLVLFPRLVRDQQSRTQATLKNLAIVAIIMAVAVVATVLLGGPAIRLAFGDDFAPATPVLLWMLPGVYCYSLATVISQYLASVGMPRGLIGVWLLGLATLMVANGAWVSEYGAIGAAMSFSVAAAGVLVLQAGLALSCAGVFTFGAPFRLRNRTGVDAAISAGPPTSGGLDSVAEFS